MEIQNQFYNMASVPDLSSVIKAQGNKFASNFNCMRIGIVQEFYPEDLTASILIANKREDYLNPNGTQNVRNFALIRAKVCYCNAHITVPINPGDECILLFADREIESWFINGDVNPIAHARMHDLTDAIAIFGIRSLPHMISILADCLNLFYGDSNIAISNNLINITSPLVQASNFHAMNGASGNIVDSNGKTLATVVDGIITEIF